MKSPSYTQKPTSVLASRMFATVRSSKRPHSRAVLMERPTISRSLPLTSLT